MVAPGSGCERAGSFTVTPKVTPKKPVYDCTALTTKLVSNTNIYEYIFSIKYTAENGAVLNKVIMSWGDNVATSDIALSELNGFKHTFAKAGSYKQTATLMFNVNDTTKTATCVSSVLITAPTPATPQTPAATPEPGKGATPTTLVNTGSADIIGMFAATAAAGIIAYRFVWLRRFNS
jgi:hypothetical protein